MSVLEHADRLRLNLLDLGLKRLVALAIVGLTVIVGVGTGAYLLSRPQYAVLYTGLERDDVTRIGTALNEAGIPYDVSAAGNAVMVGHANVSKARMLLAEKGLPYSAKAGYELFDKLGSLGITSFMQEVTRVRALEGEIARTIQGMRGIKAARVHLVMPDPGSFRREQRPPSASVVIRADHADLQGSAQAVRHLVSAAVPGMTPDKVTVLSADGTLLASGGDAAQAGGRAAGLHRTINREIEDSVRRTLTPYLGLENFEISVAAKINTDKKVVNETIFNPESKVERSIRVVRESETSQNQNRQAPTTVQQNLPNERINTDKGDQSSEETKRREDLTNFEISSKQIQTSSDGYGIEQLSIAVLVNRARLAAAAGPEAGEEGIARQIAEIEALVGSAAGYREARGDVLKVSAVSFLAGSSGGLDPVPDASLKELLLRQTGTIVNSLMILVIALTVIWFGLRPALAVLLDRPKAEAAAALGGAALGGPAGEAPPALAAPEVNLVENVATRLNSSTIKRLEQIVEQNEEQAAHILKQWMHAGETA
ncbi:flagellar basal-body MS-ring/collar protein FliF [Salinarimonas soli]|uniref:Flagellar M-ring protein n=1 Tax=Salinarimonas soli TaxID=1638099 RepID=A0A5B2VD11_9HYPH|nr:flagellar basal-body MS-ring/collar protein FliF [Salinarimonas soli]KAA2237373.1 flagellar M-ring protein FliF [Salinarimonas soli]